MLSPNSLVLVCVVPKPRDLEVVRLLGWYRIPFRTAPKLIDVDYLAFYQPSSFGEAGGRIEFIARVRGHELTTRAELFHDETEHPRAKEEYYKIQVGDLERLEHPILADQWKRLTFLYTTGEYLLNACSFNDLVVRDDERKTLWRALRERSSAGFQVENSIIVEEISEEVLALLLGFTNLTAKDEEME